ncbi:hypothetical protein TNCV_1458061 [Trichonephila clavipes]|nr:hypothetical protein TNCV_1458061 [Trichonephila clavipes]
MEFYFAIKSHCRVINAFQQRYLGETAQNASMIAFLVQRLHDTGSVADEKRLGSVHNENKSGRCGDSFTKKSIEKTVHLHKHHYKIPIPTEKVMKAVKLGRTRCPNEIGNVTEEVVDLANQINLEHHSHQIIFSFSTFYGDQEP